VKAPAQRPGNKVRMSKRSTASIQEHEVRIQNTGAEARGQSPKPETGNQW
jgi:hypothetical protein